ncbi:hypothetical protein JCM8097_001087 [Rhodosporidiobolus ruineniae]
MSTTGSSSQALISAPNGVNHLARLPYELLELIFDTAYARSNPFDPTPRPSAPLSRAFLPFYRRVVLKSVKVCGDNAAAELVLALSRDDGLGLHIRSLTFCQEFGVVTTDQLVAESSLLRALSSLPNLRHLTINRLPGLVEGVRVRLFRDSALLPQLEELVVVAPGAKRALDGWVDILARRALHRFELDVEVGSGARLTENSRSPPALPFPSFPHIRALSLSTHLDPPTLAVLPSFVGLTKLTLTNASTPCCLPFLLRFFPSPSSLQSLTLRYYGIDERSFDVDASLPMFTSLRHLDLSGPYNCSVAFFAGVRLLPLTSLALDSLKLEYEGEAEALHMWVHEMVGWVDPEDYEEFDGEV